MKNLELIVGVIVLILVVGGYFILTANLKSNQATDTQTETKVSLLGADIAYVEGAVEYKKSGGEWTRASVGTSLFQGDSIEVVGEGRAIVNLDNGSALRLNSDSSITLTSMNPNNIVIANDQGEVYTRVIKSESTFTVKAGDASYESMGTAYSTINEKKENGVEVYQSKVKVQEGEKKEVTVKEGKKYFVLNKKNPSLEGKVKGITDAQIKKDKFISWNKKKDEANKDFKKELGVFEQEQEKEQEQNQGEETKQVQEQEQEQEQQGGITLYGSATDDGVKLSWTVSGVEIPKGVKLVKSTTINPVYPGNSYAYINSSEQRSYVWPITDGGTYYFRACKYNGDGTCGVYSNNVQVTAPKKDTSYDDKDKESDDSTSKVSSITLSGTGKKVSWTLNGTSSKGFKLVWSKKSGPTYPTRSGDKYQYYSSSGTRSGEVYAFDGSGNYYVRVCEYLGGKCGTYSNQIQVTLEK